MANTPRLELKELKNACFAEIQNFNKYFSMFWTLNQSLFHLFDLYEGFKF